MKATVTRNRSGPEIKDMAAAIANSALVGEEMHQLGKRLLHLVLHLGDQLILAHIFVVEWLRIAIGKGLGAPANINKCVFKKSSFVKNDNNIPAWQTPLFTDIFNTPLGLIDDIK